MFGKNKISKPQNHNKNSFAVQEIFPTLQGEGFYVGYPAVFVRLGGCNLACNFCDTEFDSYQEFSLEKIISLVNQFAKNEEGKLIRKLVVITGGEPLLQPIEKLCEELISLGFFVQIETNGTIFRKLPSAVKIICSPKIVNDKYHQIRPDLLPHINALKFIISKSRKDYSQVAEVGQKKLQIPVYVQPMDEYDEEKNRDNLNYATNLCQSNGYILSVQLHKILGIR